MPFASLRHLATTAGLMLLLAAASPATGQEAPAASIDVEAMVQALAAPRSRGFGASVKQQAPASLSLRVNFELGSAVLTPEARALLLDFTQVLNHHKLKSKRFDIVGHTDARGSNRSNQILSEQRAQAVVDFLSQVAAVKPWRITASGRGESQLLLPDDPNNENNRRVEIIAK